MEETTTDATTQEQAPIQAQPEEQHAEAAQTPDSEPNETADQTESEETAQATNSEEDDLSDYWAKKGIDITTPEGQAKAAKSYREAEKAMTQKAQQASQLEKQINANPPQVDSDNELVRQMAQEMFTIKTKNTVSDFKAKYNITEEQDNALGQYVQSNPDKAELVRLGYLTLDDVYRMSGVGSVDPSVAKKQGGQEALQKLANKQRATAPSGSAISTNRASTGNSIADLEERLADVKF